ncbi:MAG: hypothetical protein U0Q15_12785 [Kineosporiaceae bacterium]
MTQREPTHRASARPDRCPRCAARLPADATWCSLCLAPLADAVHGDPARTVTTAVAPIPEPTPGPTVVPVVPGEAAAPQPPAAPAKGPALDEVRLEGMFEELRRQSPAEGTGWMARLAGTSKPALLLGVAVVTTAVYALFSVVGALL